MGDPKNALVPFELRGCYFIHHERWNRLMERVDRSRRLAGPGLALGSMLCIQLGAALAVPVMVEHGSFGITAMRLCCAALVMALLVRPKFSRFERRQWLGAIALGATMALMTLSYFEAVTLIPIGPAVTIDFLGPLAVAVVSLKGWPRLALPALAAFGVLAISYGYGGWLFDPIGMLFALGAACGWAGYIVLMRHVGRLFSEQEGLSLAFIAAAVVAFPLAFVVAPSELSLALLPTAAGLALLTPLIPFSLEMMALRRMDIGAFSILMSMEPAIGAIFGFLILHQILSLQQIAGVLAVMIASIGAIYLTSFKKLVGTPPEASLESNIILCDG
jgi:inner membrane transporter RhtA